jgi:aminoglycoside phosphotransferase
MAWINLIDTNGGNVFVNTDNVLWFSASGEDGHAWLITTATEGDRALSLHVKQSPAEVVALLRSARQEVAGIHA